MVERKNLGLVRAWEGSVPKKEIVWKNERGLLNRSRVTLIPQCTFEGAIVQKGEEEEEGSREEEGQVYMSCVCVTRDNVLVYEDLP